MTRDPLISGALYALCALLTGAATHELWRNGERLVAIAPAVLCIALTIMLIADILLPWCRNRKG